MCSSHEKKLYFISQIFKTNKTSVEFLPSSFHVKDLQTWAILLHGRTKDNVYERLTKSSTPIIVFSNVKVTHSDWHHFLGHHVEPTLWPLVSNYKLQLASALSPSFHCKDCYCNKSHKLSFSQSTLVSSSPCKLSSLIYGPLLFHRLKISNTTSFLLTTSPNIYGSTYSNASQMSVWFFPTSKPLLRISLNGK